MPTRQGYLCTPCHALHYPGNPGAPRLERCSVRGALARCHVRCKHKTRLVSAADVQQSAAVAAQMHVALAQVYAAVCYHGGGGAHVVTGAPSCCSSVASAFSVLKPGTRSCSLLSSCTNSLPRKSERDEKSCPILMNVGPSCRMVERSLTASSRALALRASSE